MTTQYQKIGQIDLVRVTESSGCALYLAVPTAMALWTLIASIVA